MKLRALIGAAVAVFALATDAVTWDSGPIYLPNGKIAKKGEVVGWAFTEWVTRVHNITMGYELIHGGIQPGVGSVRGADGKLINFLLLKGECDEDGVVQLGDGGTHPDHGSGYARVYYICKYDGYEYYIAANGTCTTASAQPVYNTTGLAGGSRAKWTRGYELPREKRGFMLIISSILSAWLSVRM